MTAPPFLLPDELFKQLVKETEHIPLARLFNDPRYQKHREKWIAAQLGGAVRSLGIDVQVRIVQAQPDEADFHLRCGPNELSFQCTEVQTPGRRRGDDYNRREKEPSHVTPYEPQVGMQKGPEWIRAAVQQKVAKHYAVRPHMIVYANFYAESLDPKAIRAECSAHNSACPSLWIMQNHRLIQLWESRVTEGWATTWVCLPFQLPNS